MNLTREQSRALDRRVIEEGKEKGKQKGTAWNAFKISRKS